MTDPDSTRADLYAALGVASDATEREIREAYRLLACELHPDRRPGDQAAEERFKQATAAYRVLADPERRAAYDRDRRVASTTGSTAGRRRRPGATGPVTIPVQHLRGDYLRAPHDPRNRRTGSARPSGRGPARRVGATIPFERALLGGTVTVPLAAAGGQGSIDVDLPAGVRDGQTVRVPRPGGADDVDVVIRVEPHPHFGRKGDDITLTIPVTYPEAVLGAEIPVPLPGGERITVRVPPGTPSGRVLRVRGRGAPAGTGRGDLLATVHIAVPREVGDAERRALEALAATSGANPRDDPFWEP